MSEWWSYNLSDFLLFSPRVYWRMFELHNAAVWPVQLVTLAGGVAMLLLTIWRPSWHGRAIAVILALIWVFVAWSFLWQRYMPINWAIVHVVPVFVLQALLLFIMGGVRDQLSFDRHGFAAFVGYLLIVFAITGQPLLAPLLGRSWSGAEIFGIAPDPTVIGTLGFLLLARGRLSTLLFLIPVLWCLLSAVTLWAMDAPQVWVMPAAALLALGTRLYARDVAATSSRNI